MACGLNGATEVTGACIRACAFAALVVSGLVGCGNDPKHLDDRLASQIITNALADKSITIKIAAGDPANTLDRAARASYADEASEPAAKTARDAGRDSEAQCEIDAANIRGLAQIEATSGPGSNPFDSGERYGGAMRALERAGYVTGRYRFVDLHGGCSIPIYVFTADGKAESTEWRANGNDTYTALVGTGYTIEDIRGIRFFANNGADYATLSYTAVPILNEFGQLMARSGDYNMVFREHHRATLLLLDDGWALSAAGLQ